MMAVMAKARDDNVSRIFVFRTLSNKSSSHIILRIIPVENKTFCGFCTGGETSSKRKGVPCRRGPWPSGDFLLDGAGVFPRPPHSTPSLFSKNFSGFRGIQDTLRAVPLFMDRACPSLKDNLLIY